MDNDYGFDFIVGISTNANNRTKEIFDSINKSKSDTKENVLASIQKALLCIGVLNRPIVVDMRIVNNREFNEISKMVHDSTLNCCKVNYEPTKFKHTPINTISMHFDTRNVYSIVIADSVFGLGVHDIFNDFNVSQSVVILVNENDIIDIYDAYYKDNNDIEMLYDLTVEALRKFIPLFSIYALDSVLENSLVTYNKYTLSMLITAIARLSGIQFNINVCLDNGECNLRIASYEKAFFTNLERLARSVLNPDELWMDSSILEAHLGAVVGCGRVIGCVPGIQSNIDMLSNGDDCIKNRLEDYYESLNELIEMLSETISTYVMNTSAEYIKDVYIGEKIPVEKINELTLKLKEVKARHKRVIKYADNFDELEEESAERRERILNALERDKYSGVVQLAMDNLVDLKLPFSEDDFEDGDEFEALATKEVSNICSDIEHVIKTGKFADDCRTRELTTPENLAAVEALINKLVIEHDSAEKAINSLDTDEWMVAHESLIEMYED